MQNIHASDTSLWCWRLLVPERPVLDVLSTYHRKSLHYIQHLPEATAIPVLYILIGTLPVEAVVDIRALSFFCSIAATNLLQLTTIFHLQSSSRTWSLARWQWRTKTLQAGPYTSSTFSGNTSYPQLATSLKPLLQNLHGRNWCAKQYTVHGLSTCRSRPKRKQRSASST